MSNLGTDTDTCLNINYFYELRIADQVFLFMWDRRIDKRNISCLYGKNSGGSAARVENEGAAGHGCGFM